MPIDRRPSLTDEQQAALSTKAVSVGLSAGAGCGKTFVLTRRFLAQLDPDWNAPKAPARLGQLVAITFTERAAREMRDRIRAACRQRLIEGDGRHADHWRELVREMDSARISTIHAFCGSLLRSHAVEAKLDPRFRVLDQAQADTLLYELIDEQLRGRLAEQDEAVIALVVQFGLGGLGRMIADLLDRRQEVDWPQWTAETPESLTARWHDYWRREGLPRLLRELCDMPDTRTLLRIIGESPPSHPVMLERCHALRERFEDLAGCADPAASLEDIHEAAKVQGGGGKKAWPSDELYDQFKTAAEGLRKRIKSHISKGRLSFDDDQCRPAAEMALRLLEVASGVAEAYEARKAELAALDFDDLLIHTHRLLTGPDSEAFRERLGAQMRLLLVDEFQDTDPLQVELVKALCGAALTRGKLFFVGDYKQSIYRFRGARPKVFRKLRDTIPEKGRLPLSLNFRSQPAVLDFVNALFCEEFTPGYEPLRAHRPQVSPTPAVEFLWATPDGNDGNTGATGDDASSADQQPASDGGDYGEDDDSPPAERLRRREAEWIARRIRRMLDDGERIVWDANAAKAGEPAVRAARPGDVAILFRALSNVGFYEEALQRHGIDYYLVGGHAFYAQQEIYDLLSLLRSLESPADEVSLIGVLRSPMFGLWDETIFWLARHADGLAAGLMADRLPEPLDPQQRKRTTFAATTLGDLRAMKDRLPIARLIDEALRRTGYDAVLLAEFLGERKLANLRKLVDQARSMDRSGMFRLSDFITQLSQFVARQPKEALAATCGEAADVVRLMSVHQSKGLEFPVVVVPDMDRIYKGVAANTTAAFTKKLGPMVKMSGTAGGFELFTADEDAQQQDELVRLLYVATTRAADYLILSAGCEALGKPKGPWLKTLAKHFDLTTGAIKREVDPDPMPDIRVTTVCPELHGKASVSRRQRNLKKLLEGTRKMVDRGLGHVPPHLGPVPVDALGRRQYSFSRLTGMLHDRPAVSYADPLEEADGASRPALDPRGLGTLVHAVLAEVDFGKPTDVPELVARHAQRHLPNVDGDTLAEPVEWIERFLGSERAAEVAAASVTYPELEFLLRWPPDNPQPGGPYLQGFIDCLYQDADGGWHLLDYKTNRVRPEQLAALAAEYEMQMLVYGLAAERILGRPPVELVLHFLRGGLEHQFAWDETSRARLATLVAPALGG